MFNWIPAYGLSCTACDSPIASPTVTTTYYVTVTDSMGMDMDSITVTVELRCSALFIPNAFSPNADGQNDVFYVKGIIFDRWGQKYLKQITLLLAATVVLKAGYLIPEFLFMLSTKKILMARESLKQVTLLLSGNACSLYRNRLIVFKLIKLVV